MMDYALTLQGALVGAMEEAGIAGGRVFDRVPSDAASPYVSIGPADETAADAECIEAVEISQQIDVWSTGPGFVEAKQIASQVRAALHRRTLTVGQVSADIEVRTIRYLRDRDGITSHAVIDLRALIERG